MEPVAIRRSFRLNGCDYATADSYFITICTQHKEHRFGRITDGVMHLNEAGCMIEGRIQAIPTKFPGTLIDSHVVMPNHVHFILMLLGFQPNEGLVINGGYVGAAGIPAAPTHERSVIDQTNDANQPAIDRPDLVINVPSVADVVGWFKASTTNYYIKAVKSELYPAFDRRLWQRNYYEHIIRTEAAYNQIDEYIHTNPLRWSEDRLR